MPVPHFMLFPSLSHSHKVSLIRLHIMEAGFQQGMGLLLIVSWWNCHHTQWACAVFLMPLLRVTSWALRFFQGIATHPNNVVKVFYLFLLDRSYFNKLSFAKEHGRLNDSLSYTVVTPPNPPPTPSHNGWSFFKHRPPID